MLILNYREDHVLLLNRAEHDATQVKLMFQVMTEVHQQQIFVNGTIQPGSSHYTVPMKMRKRVQVLVVNAIHIRQESLDYEINSVKLKTQKRTSNSVYSLVKNLQRIFVKLSINRSKIQKKQDFFKSL